MNIQVVNEELCVSTIRVIAVASSSVLLVGDTQNIITSSFFDTFPEEESLGPFVPLPAVSR